LVQLVHLLNFVSVALALSIVVSWQEHHRSPGLGDISI